MKRNPYLYFTAMGMELVAIEIAMIQVGSLIDKRMGWSGYALAGGSIIGLVGWLLHIFYALRDIEK